MKKYYLFILIVGIFAQSNSFSQTNCNRTSAFWSNNMNFIPDSIAPSYVMPLNFIIVRKSDGTGNFPNNALTWDIFSDAIDLLNETYNNLVPLNPNDSLEFDSCFNVSLGESDFIPSIKIQFVLDSIYFIDSTTFWGSISPSQALMTYVESNYSDGFNIYFPIQELAWQCYAVDFDPCTVVGSNYATFPNATDMSYSQHMAIRNFYAFYLYNRYKCSLETDTLACYQWLINENKKALGRIMSHEFGHTFGLSHTCAHYTILNQCDYTIMHQGGGAVANWLPPSEIGIMHRLIHTSSVRRYFPEDTYFTDKKYLVSNYQLWDYNIRVYGDVIIENGGIVELKCILHMPEQAKIVIKPGGKLIVNGGRITSYGNYLWQGIEVWGNSDASQFPINGVYSQGIVELINGAVIENAMDGIRNHKPNDLGSRGGIIRCDSAVFKNNRRAVEFLEYRNFHPNNPSVRVSDLSYFKNSTFTVDDDYIGPNEFFAHVSMCNVQGVRFTECTFENSNNSTPSSNFYNNGIFSIDAGYTVNGRCDIITQPGAQCPEQYFHPSTFTGFNYGIRSGASSTSAKTVNVNGCTFEKNNYGVYIAAQNNFWVNRNKFILGDGISTNGSYFGIFSSSSSGYRIEENKFFADQNQQGNTLGIVISSSGIANNLVYKNEFNEIMYGLNSGGLNRNPNNNSIDGLKFLCNENNNSTNNIYNISVFGKNPQNLSHGIAMMQIADNNTSAGNTFSDATNNSEGHYKNDCNPIYYAFSGVANSTNPYFPTHVTGNNKVMTISPQYTNQCLSKFSIYNISDFEPLSSGVKYQLNVLYDATELDYTNMLYTYNQLIDGGNTTALLNEIQLSWSQQAWELRDKLIDVTPFLSQEALVEAAFSDILPQAMLFEICMLNPGATIGEEFIDIIGSQIQNPLPQYMLDLIIANWSTETPRLLIEQSLSQLGSKMSFLSDLLISDMMLDSISLEPQILNWLNRRAGLNDLLTIAEFHISHDNFTSAIGVLDYISANFELSDEQTTELDEYYWYCDFRQYLITCDRSIANLENEEINLLEDFVISSEGRIAEFCSNILCFFYGRCQQPDIYPEIEPRKFRQPFTQSGSNLQTNYIRVYPNPANTYTTFEWTIPGNTNAIIRISTPTGIILKTHEFSSEKGQWLWDTRDVQSGVYMYELMKGNQRLESGRIGVVK